MITAPASDTRELRHLDARKVCRTRRASVFEAFHVAHDFYGSKIAIVYDKFVCEHRIAGWRDAGRYLEYRRKRSGFRGRMGPLFW